ncbi:MAG: DUF2169 domain-containing protein [Myxococcota bacterium]
MDTVNESTLSVASFAWKARPPRPALTVVVKGTFDLVHKESLRLSKVQRPCHGEERHDQDPDRSLRLDTDLAPFKPSAELLLAGSAFVPGGRETTQLAVGLSLGDIRNEFLVHGDRVWEGRLRKQPSQPVPFSEMPLCLERSFGGPGHKTNPWGRGLETVANGSHPLPNLEAPDRSMHGPSARPDPVSAFPVPLADPRRQALAGTYDARWQAERFPWFPEDLSWECFLSGPAMQRRRGYFEASEALTLRHLHRHHTIVRTTLPEASPEAVLRTSRGESPLRLNLDTVTVDTDAEEVILVWRALVELELGETANELRVLPATSLLPRSSLRPSAVPETGGPLPPSPPISSSPTPPMPNAPIPNALMHWSESTMKLGPDGLPVENWDATTTRFIRNAKRPTTLPPGRVIAPIEGATPDEPSEKVSEQPPGSDDAVDRAMKRLDEALAELELPLIDPPSRPERSPEDILAALESTGLAVPEDLRRHLFSTPAPTPPVEPEAPTEAPAEPTLRDRVIVARDEGTSLDGFDLTGANLSGLDLSRMSFRGAILAHASFEGSILAEAVLADATLGNAVLRKADLSGANLRSADLQGVDAEGTRFDRADLQRADLSESTLASASFQRADLQHARLVAAELGEADLRRACLKHADLDRAQGLRARLEEADLREALLSNANFRSARFHGAALQGVRADGLCLENGLLGAANAAGGTFDGARFARANLVQANLAEAYLAGADFSDAELDAATLRRARLDQATLRRATLRGADLFESRLEGADLRDADLRLANLFGAELFEARFEGAQLTAADLRRTKQES